MVDRGTTPSLSPFAAGQTSGQNPAVLPAGTPPYMPTGSTSSSTGTTASAIYAIELAIAELQQTVDEALAYRMAPSPRPQILRSHVQALQEDLNMLTSLNTTDDSLRTQAAQLIFLARRTKRNVEREAITLEVQQSEEQPRVQDSIGDQVKQGSIKFTPLQLPQFDGQPSQFLIFRNFFEENILHNSTLTDTTKWLRLKECLKGQPADLVAELPQTSTTLEVAWKLLLEIYGGEERPIVDLYNKLQSMQPASSRTASLRLTHSRLEGILMSLEHLGHDIEQNHYLRWVVVSKFPPDVLYHIPQKKETTLRDMRRAIAEVIATRELTDYQRVSTTSTESRSRPQATTAPNASSLPPTSAAIHTTKKTPSIFPRNPKCVFCTSEHWNDSCDVYPTLSARKERIAGRCFKCLRIAHEPAACAIEKRCFHCDSLQHNRALCPVKFAETVPPAKPVTTLALVDSSPQPEHRITGCFLTFQTQVSSPYSHDSVQMRIVVDTAGGATLLRKEAAALLQLPCSAQPSTEFTGLNGQHLVNGRPLQADIQLLAENGELISVRPAVVPSIVPDVPVIDVHQFRRDHPAYDHLHIPPTGAGEPVDLLLGSDALVDVLKADKIIDVNANTLLMPTKFGWLILGRKREQQLKVCHAIFLNLLSNPLKLMSDLDLVGLAALHNTDIEEEQLAIKKFYETVTFQNGRYSISWPWRTYPPNLDTNFGLALGRLKSLWKRLQTVPHLLHEYHGIILKQLQDGVIEKVSLNEPTPPHTHYVPHHPVLQPGKSTSLRPVYDGAAKANPRRLSLNENILKGTKWLNDLVETLLRFRKTKTVVTADIAKAFHQIAINKSDRDAVRFAWLKNPECEPNNENLQIYRFTRVAFGVVASPFILHATIHHHATQQPPNRFMDIILRDMYADNLVTALDDSIDPKEFYQYAKKFFNTMSMNLTKWSSNDSQFRSFLPEEDRLPDDVFAVLGLKWDNNSDTLSLKTPKLCITNPPTRRTVARDMASHFDPLGWVSPILLLAKNFFRRIWEETEKWDTPLTTNNKAEWSQILGHLRQIVLLKLPRRMHHLQRITSFQLHTFVDASQRAYAVVTYLRVQSDEDVQISLLASKSRLAPKKQLTIPKLELIAMVLGCKFTQFITTALQLVHKVETFVWSDSRCVIAWMQQKRLLPPIINKYVDQAVACGINNIFYVPSERNYADIATRGGTYEELLSMKWWSGPHWLIAAADWPVQPEFTVPETYTSLFFQNQLATKKEIISEEEIQGVATLSINEFSTLTKLLRRTALCFKALNKFSKRNLLQLETDIDLNAAKRWWLFWDQSREYALRSEPEAGKPFPLHGIQVFRDNDGLIRCHTRLLNSVAGLDTATPVLLVKKSTLTRLIILHIHQLHHHAGTSHTLANLRQDYWLPHGRREVYITIHNHCLHCRRYSAQPYPTPPPPPLPDFRTLKTQHPFQIVGIDIFGPFYTRAAIPATRQKTKVYGLLFTCAVIRAVHIEMLHEMTTLEISFAFRRFVARRGTPLKIVSDNAPQFHQLDGCFQDLWKTLAATSTISTYFAEHNIVWHFITETAPWMGGFYERLIQTIKKSLEKTYGDKVLLDRQMEATLIEIEAILNSRPITYIDRDATSPIVTPNDFLTSTFVSIPVETVNNATDNHIHKLWRSSQQYLQEFWKNWSQQYLLMLRDRHDHLRSNKSKNASPEKGDVVLMVDVTKKRSAWQLAVVERRITSQDGHIRSVQIRIPNGSRLIRPVIALAPLNIIMDLPRVTDDQLNSTRDAITLVPPEGASQEYSIANEENTEKVEWQIEEERSNREREAESGGSGAVPYHSNGSENELGSATAEPALEGPSSEAASSAAGSVVEDHE